MQKKIIGVLLLFSLAAFSFTGCKDKQKKDSTTESSSSVEEKKQTETSKEEESSTMVGGDEATTQDAEKKPEENNKTEKKPTGKAQKINVKKKKTKKVKKVKKVGKTPKPKKKLTTQKYINIPHDFKKSDDAANVQQAKDESKQTVVHIPPTLHKHFNV